jgi:protein-S-isoprenylcysteine O-methyltransferase Ste14
MNMQKPRLKSYIFVVVQFLSMGLIIFPGNIIPEGIYLFPFVAGILLIGWAIGTMEPGKFNIVPDLKVDSKLVTTGPYSFIRHPMYSAILMIMTSLVLSNFSYLKLAFWLVLFIDLILKLSYEEEMLKDNFFEYPEYIKRTKRLFPYIF